MQLQRITICGGGNAAHVLIALLASAGCEVSVYAPFGDEAEQLRRGSLRAGGVTARSANGRVWRGTPTRISAHAAEVFPQTDLALLALPASAHAATLAAAAPHLRPGAWVAALPARGGFDWEARQVLGDEVTLAGLQTLPWACRITPGRYGEGADILGSKRVVDIAVQPAHHTAAVTAMLSQLLDVALEPAGSFLALTLANTGQIIHPGIMYGLFKNWDGTPYGEDEVPLFYAGIDAGIADVLAAMSDEVQQICGQIRSQTPDLDLSAVLPLQTWLQRSYSDDIAEPSTLLSCFTTNRAYAGLTAPMLLVEENALAPWFHSRYLTEDVPFGLLATRGIAELCGVATPVIDAVITWAQEVLGRQWLVGGSLAGADMPATRAPQRFGIRARHSAANRCRSQIPWTECLAPTSHTTHLTSMEDNSS